MVSEVTLCDRSASPGTEAQDGLHKGRAACPPTSYVHVSALWWPRSQSVSAQMLSQIPPWHFTREQPVVPHSESLLTSEIEPKRTPVSHKVIEKRRRDRINRCLNELGKTVPMALAKQSSGKLEKAEILEMTVQYLRALHSADFPRGREKAELLAEFANYFHYGYHECMKNLVHYLTTVERMETKDTKYARILAFLQSKARLGTEPAFQPLGSLPEPDFSYQLHPAGPEFAGHSPELIREDREVSVGGSKEPPSLQLRLRGLRRFIHKATLHK
ncbi:hypothetical protein E5288_WYG014143 [Bos mutus]|uniref:Hairy and enhancer of split-related protein HELT n=1 Tax=Bos mutus TaxID=72004 RepID=A0A6B0R8W3_9CETA|nr:hypothetical protein [Bos mutus]